MLVISLSLALALALQAPAASVTAPEPELSKSKVDALIASCPGRRFEAPFEVQVGGKVRRSSVKLCGKAGQTESEWARTLQDAVRNVESSRMPPEAKEQVVTALRDELAKLSQAAPAAAAIVPLPAPILAPAPAAPPAEYSALPPLPTPVPSPSPVSPPSEYTASPALRAPAPVAAARPVVRAAAVAPRPRLSFRCLTAGEGGEAPCTGLERDSFLVVRADDELKPGSSLRFVRRGDVRSVVPLAPMSRGKSVKVRLPKPVCAGVVRSQVEIQLLGGGSVVETIGPLELRC
jgi:hypothetical protein